jgi:large subunit ribosomal protein L30
MPAKSFIVVRQKGSPIRRHWSQRATLIGLGLNRIGRIAWVPDDSQSWGMIAKVRHLVDILDELTLIPISRKPNEAADVKLAQDLLRLPPNVAWQRFLKKEKNKPTPDFKILKDGVLAGYCEVKSPRDDRAFEPQNPKPGEIFMKKRMNPAAKNLERQISDAVEQFDSVNPDHALPNVLIIANHAIGRDPANLQMLIEGVPMPDGSKVPMLPGGRQREVRQKARRIDLIVWIDVANQTCVCIRPIGASHLADACDLFGIDPEG